MVANSDGRMAAGIHHHGLSKGLMIQPRSSLVGWREIRDNINNVLTVHYTWITVYTKLHVITVMSAVILRINIAHPKLKAA